jgi:hypothetical protein
MARRKARGTFAGAEMKDYGVERVAGGQPPRPIGKGQSASPRDICKKEKQQFDLNLRFSFS